MDYLAAVVDLIFTSSFEVLIPEAMIYGLNFEFRIISLRTTTNRVSFNLRTIIELTFQ